jgi:signal transduction histidine kinase
MVITDRHATVDTFRETCRQVLKENEYQEQLIDALLTLAQGQRGLERTEPVDLAEVVHAVIDAHQLAAVTNGVRIEASIVPALISGDRRLVERLVSNVIENAVRHNIHDGRVQIAVQGDRDMVVLDVANTGSVVPAAEIRRLLAPFQRLSRDRIGHGDGLGLGLSIVAAVAAAHHAQLDVTPRDGGGLRVAVRFPEAGDSAAIAARELVLEDLAERVARQSVDEVHDPRPLERGESFSGERQ